MFRFDKNNQIKNIDFLGKKSQLEASELLASSRLLLWQAAMKVCQGY